jgi:hypothetical protein
VIRALLVEEARYQSVVNHVASGRARIEQDTAVVGISSYERTPLGAKAKREK